MFHYTAKVTRMVDADTFDVSIDLGFDVWVKQRIRVAGIDAPERYTDEGKEAEHYLRERFGMPGRSDEPVACEVYTEKDGRGKYGRYIATIFVDGFNVGQALVEDGHAVFKDY